MNHFTALRLLPLFVVTLLLAGCAAKPKRYVIGVSQCSEDIWRAKLNDELRTGEYLNDSIQIKLTTAHDDSKVQIRQINQLVDEGVDLLVVSPNQQDVISSAIDRAYDKGIPVILYDRKTGSDKYTSFIGCDNYVIGTVMGRFIAHRLNGKGRVAEVRGLEGSSPALERHRGFVDVIKHYPGIQLVASEAGDWKEAGGAAAMRRILAKTQDFDYVFSHNDRMAMGAREAAMRMGLRRGYKYTGVDGLPGKGGGLELVRDGVLEASYLYSTKGDEVIALAMKILKGLPYKRDNCWRTSIVTKDNAELILMEAQDGERQRKKLDVLHRQVDRYLADYNAQKVMLTGLGVLLLVIIVATALVYRGYIVKTQLNEELGKRNEEQNRLNAELAGKNAELERLNKEVMELTHSRLMFFTNISHELRTPLTLIADPVEMLLEDRSIQGKSRDLLRMVQRNALSLQQLIGAILDFRKIQNGKMTLALCSFDMAEALALWVGDFRLAAERKHIRLHLDVSGFATREKLTADKEKVARIVFNLLSNALKYTPAGGDIFVTLRDGKAGDGCGIDAQTAKDYLRIDVRDTGKGIAPGEADKVFERFFQAKGAASGTGIGLALVKSFVDLHHGEVRVESLPGEGADFVVVLPRHQAGEQRALDNRGELAGDAHTAASPGQMACLGEGILPYAPSDGQRDGKLRQLASEDIDKPTILIIDDNSDIRQYERTLLQDRYMVMEASDGQEGLDMARKEVPDLVVCDVMMPVMDGLELTEQLKTTVATSHIPVILLTAKHLDEQRAEGYEHGADSYITKPFRGKVLLARIENLLRQRQLLREVFKSRGAAEAKMGDDHLDDRDKQFIRQLHDIIQRSMGDNELSVEDIGRQVGLSRVQLYRKVKAMTGSSVVDLLRKARLAKARRLIESRSMSVSEVAYEVGFSSPSYFTKCFKEEFGMLPGEMATR